MSANSSADHIKWALRAEARALQVFLDQGYTLLYHRKKIFGVEVDLILWSPEGHVLFLEVKTLGRFGLVNSRLSKKQQGRLNSAKMFFESVYGLPVEVRLAFVDATNGDVTDMVIL